MAAPWLTPETRSRCRRRERAGRGFPRRRPGSFFEGLHGLRVLTMRLRPRREAAVAHRPERAPERLPACRDPELLPQPGRHVDQPPAHHPVAPGQRAVLHSLRQRGPVLGRQKGRLAGRLAVDQPRRPRVVEPQHPVAHDLQPDTANPGSIRPASAIVDRCQRQQAPRLLRVPARLRLPSQVIRPCSRSSARSQPP